VPGVGIGTAEWAGAHPHSLGHGPGEGQAREMGEKYQNNSNLKRMSANSSDGKVGCVKLKVGWGGGGGGGRGCDVAIGGGGGGWCDVREHRACCR